MELIQELTAEMEANFKENGLDEQLHDLVDKALEMTDEQISSGLLVMRSSLVVAKGRVRNIFNLKNEDGDVDQFIDASRLQNTIPWDPNATYKDQVPMGLWRRVVEIEALNRDLADIDLSRFMSVIAQKASEIVVEPMETDASEEPSELPSEGFTAKNAPPSVCKKVVALRKAGWAFHAIEKQLGLRRVRGMTAHRIFQKYKHAKKAK